MGFTSLAFAFLSIIPSNFFDYRDTIDSLHSSGSNITPSEAAAQVHQESAYNKDAVSYTGCCYGLGQFSKDTAVEIFPLVNCDPETDLFDPICQLKAHKLYMNRLFNAYRPRFDNPTVLAQVAYNGGYGNLRKEINACIMRPGCNPRKWYRHVERICLRAEWACRENRDYPIKIERLTRTYESVFSE